jgi:hypothetical protein
VARSHRVKISTGERTLMRQNNERIAGWIFDQKGKLRIGVRVADNGDTDVLRVDEKGFSKVYSCRHLRELRTGTLSQR